MTKKKKVFVAPEELSLAIGKEGQNVRLASKLTGYRIEIEGKDELSQLPPEPKEKAKAESEPVAPVVEESKPEEVAGSQSHVAGDVQESVEGNNPASPSLNETQPSDKTKKTVGAELSSDSPANEPTTGSQEEPVVEAGQSANASETEVKTEKTDKTS